METISLSKIVPDKDQPRKYFAAEKMATLKDSIKKHGIISPLTVEKQGDKYLLIDGERRFRAAQELNLKEVPYIVIKSKDPLSRMIERFHIQEQHEEWHPSEKAQTIAEIGDMLNKPITAVCELLSVSVREGRMYAAFGRLQNKDKFIEYQCSIVNAEKIDSIKKYAKKLKEDILGEAFNKADEKKLEKVIIEKIKDKEIENLWAYSKIRDSFTANPKLIDKFMNGSEEISNMFVKSKASGARALRNLVFNAGYVSSHAATYLKNPDIALTSDDKSALKGALRHIKKVLDAAGADYE